MSAQNVVNGAQWRRVLIWPICAAALAMAIEPASAKTPPSVPVLAGARQAAVSAAPPPQQLEACNPFHDLLAKGEALNAKGDFDGALKLVAGLPLNSQDDFQVSFFKGKTLYLKSAKDPNRWNPPLPLSPTMAEGFDVLTKTADRLPSVPQACVALTNPYSILNTIGAFYLNRGYFREAQDYLVKAYAALDKVPKDTRRKVCDNLGLVYLVQLQPDPAMRYYKEGLKYGSKVAPAQIKKALSLKKPPPAGR